MIEEFGLVIGIRDNLAEIEPQRRATCDHCDAKSACGTSLIDRFLGRRPLRLWVENTIGAKVGERVILGIEDAVLLRAAASAYLAPLGGLIVGAMVGLHGATSLGWTNPDLGSLVGGVVGFALAMRWVSYDSHRLRHRPGFQATLLGRVGEEEGSCLVTFSSDR